MNQALYYNVYSRIEVATKDPEAEKARDRLLCSSEVVEVEAGGDEPPLERALAPLGD